MNANTARPQRRSALRKLPARAAATLLLAFSAIAPAMDVAPQTIPLKDGGTLIIKRDRTMYHADAAGYRVRMRDGVVMEAKDGARYTMKNDAVWKQIIDKGTLSAH